jgi:O-antigen/teichoic acid export membrane protein
MFARVTKLKSVHALDKITRLFPENSLTNKASLNALASILDYSANITVAFLVTPLMVFGLGDFYFGAWQVLNRLTGYITPASGRPTQTLKFALAQVQYSNDYNLKRSFVGSTLIVCIFFLPILSLLGGMLIWFVPYWIKTSAESFMAIRVTCAILVAALITNSLVSVPQSVLEGENKGYKRMGISAFLVLLGGGLVWLALYFKAGIVGVAAATLTSSILSGLFYLKIVKVYAPWFGIEKPDRTALREFFGLSWWFLAWNLIMNAMIASDVVVLALLNSVESVTNYTLAKYGPETAITLVAIMVFGILPGLGGIIGSGDLERAARVRGEIMTFTWLIVTALGTGMLLWNRTFITLWVGRNHWVGSGPNLFIVLVVVQFVFIRNDANVIDLTLDLARKVSIGGISVSLSLIAAGSLVYFFNMGIIGICLGLIFGRAILSMQYPFMIGRMLQIEMMAQLKSILRPAMTTAVLFTAASLIDSILPTGEWHSPGAWAALIFAAGPTLCAALALAFFIGLSAKQKTNVLRRFRAILPIRLQ